MNTAKNVKGKASKTKRKINDAASISYNAIVQAREKIKQGREQLDSLERTLDKLESEQMAATQN